MPTPNKNETEKDFVDRCIPVVLKDGSAKNNEQAAAMCHSMYKEGTKETKAVAPEREVRAFVGAELRVTQDKGRRKIVGYAARFNSDSVDMGFIEQVAPGAFKRTLDEKADVRALVDHNPTLILGRTKAGTLSMVEDDKGLRIEIDPPETQTARDIMQSIDRGDIDAMSFGFQTRSDAWDYEAEPPRRTLTDVELYDVSVVTFPAYPETSVALRSLEHARAEAKAAKERLEAAKAALEKRAAKP